MSANLILIVSYPKSGNTWARLVMQGLLDPRRAGAINGIEIGLYGSDRRRAFDEFAPALASQLLPEEIDTLLPSVYEEISARSTEPVFLKVHECAHRNAAGEWIFPPHTVRSVLHLVRHPFDVAVSYAEHLACPVDLVLDLMADTNHGLCNEIDCLAPPMRELLGSWSTHANSWLDDALPYGVTIARYEDLHRDDLSGFRRLAEAVPFPGNWIDERLEHAVTSARFEQVQARERSAGFREKPESASSFFTLGRPQRWKNFLSVAQRERIVRDHGTVMDRLGYCADGKTLPLLAPPTPI